MKIVAGGRLRFDLNQSPLRVRGHNDYVRTFVFRCPTTGYNVQGRYEDPNGPLPAFVGQHCLACNGLHVVDPRTGKGMSELRAIAVPRRPSDPTSSTD